MTEHRLSTPATARHAGIAAALALPMPAKLAMGAIVAVVALLVVGVPVAILASFAGPAMCLGMMLLMSHGMHGGSHNHDR